MSRKLYIMVYICVLGLLVSCNPTEHAPGEMAPPPSTSDPTDLVRFTGDNFAGSGNCAICHSDLFDEKGNDVSMDTHWRASMMANSAIDPYWQAKVSTEIERHPELQAVIEDVCATCHMPMAHTQAAVEGSVSAVMAPGFLDATHPYHDAAMDGVSCALCHQIQPSGLGESASFGGNFVIDTSTEPPNRIVFGPYPDPDIGMMMAFLGYEPQYSTHIKDAALCATCHTLYTPYLDDAGEVAGTFPEQTPFLEWLHSDYPASDTTCQRCHMPAAAGVAPVTNRPTNVEIQQYGDFAQHHFVGGNVTMLKLHRDNAEALGITAKQEHFEATLARTEDQLQEMTARLTVLDTLREDNTLTVQLKVDNYAGHKFPTGFPSRRTWLHVTVTDAAGEIVFESGRPQADGSIVGANADEHAADYEPHYDLITMPEQVQIYEAVMYDVNGAVTYTLLRASGYVKDNRILPLGFDKTSAIADIAPQGNAATDTTFNGGQDIITYAIEVQGHSGPFTVQADVLYQSLAYRAIQDLLTSQNPTVQDFGAVYASVDKTPTVVAAIGEISIE